MLVLIGAAQGLANGVVVALSRIPDVVATLTTGFIYGGVALLILERPGGGAPAAYLNIAAGSDFGPWCRTRSGDGPLRGRRLVAGEAVAHRPHHLRRGIDPVAAFRSGVNVRDARTSAYVFSGLACALGGMSLTMTTGIVARCRARIIRSASVAAVVIGGVSLTGGRGGVVGPVIAAILLTLAPMALVFLGIDPNYGQVIQGTLIVLVVMIAWPGFAFLQERK